MTYGLFGLGLPGYDPGQGVHQVEIADADFALDELKNEALGLAGLGFILGLYWVILGLY